MGKSQKPLRILVTEDLWDRPEIQVLAEKGHDLMRLNMGTNEPPYDLIFGARCWRMAPELLPYLDLAIKGARGVKYLKKSVASGVTEGQPTSVKGKP